MKKFLLICLFYPVFSFSENIDNKEIKIANSSHNITNKKTENVDSIINSDVSNGFGGAVIIVIKDGKIVKETAYGHKKMFIEKCETNADYSIPKKCYLSDSKKSMMTIDSVFDLASLTKVYSTVFALMHLMYENKLDIDKPVSYYIKDFPYTDITVRQVAEHTAGFGPEVNFYNKNDIMSNGSTVEENGFYSQDRNTTIDFLTGQNNSGNNPNNLVVPREYEPGTTNIYSDTDFMLLGLIVENIVDMRLDKYVEETIYKPLNIGIKYNPLDNGIDHKQIVQTAIGNWAVKCKSDKCAKYPYDNMRQTTIEGSSHDEKSFYSMGGVSGHAGIFGSAQDLAVLIKVLLNHGSYKGVTLFNQKIIDLFISPVGTDYTYGIGWRRAGSYGKNSSVMGDYASDMAYGHTGFTGMDTVIDPKHNLAIILLTTKLQSQQLSKPKFLSSEEYITPNYGKIISLVQKEYN